MEDRSREIRPEVEGAVMGWEEVSMGRRGEVVKGGSRLTPVKLITYAKASVTGGSWKRNEKKGRRLDG